MTVTDTQILTAIADLTTEKGYPPTIRKLGSRIGLSSTSSVSRRCLGLAGAGLLEPYGTKKARGIRLTPAGAHFVLGETPASIPAATRVQRVPVLRSSASLLRFLEMPAHREAVASAKSLVHQDVQIIPIVELRAEGDARPRADRKPFFVFDRMSGRLERKPGGQP